MLFLVLSPLLGFIKVFLVSIIDLSGFGNYSLAIMYSIWLSYLINSGAYEGLLKRYTYLLEKQQFEKIKELNAQVSSVWMVLLILAIVVASIFVLVTGLYFVSSCLLLAVSTVSFNIFSAKLRVTNNIFQISLVQLVRLSVSLSLTYSLLTFTDLSLGSILFWDSLILCCISITIFAFSFIANFNTAKFYKRYKMISLSSVNLTYVSGIRAFALLLERQFANIMLDEKIFNQYSQLLLLFQAAIVAFGIIPQIWQQNIMVWTIKNGIKKAFLYQIYFILILVILWSLLWSLIFVFILPNIFTEYMLTILLIGIASVIYGASFIDSILLGAKNNKGLIKYYSIALLFCIIIFIAYRFVIKDWFIEHQAGFLILLTISIFAFPSFLMVRKINQAEKMKN